MNIRRLPKAFGARFTSPKWDRSNFTSSACWSDRRPSANQVRSFITNSRRVVRFVNPLIREATIDDAVAISDLAEELGYPALPERMRSRLITILGRSDHLVLVAMNELGAVHGWIHA